MIETHNACDAAMKADNVSIAKAVEGSVLQRCSGCLLESSVYLQYATLRLECWISELAQLCCDGNLHAVA